MRCSALRRCWPRITLCSWPSGVSGELLERPPAGRARREGAQAGALHSAPRCTVRPAGSRLRARAHPPILAARSRFI